MTSPELLRRNEQLAKIVDPEDKGIGNRKEMIKKNQRTNECIVKNKKSQKAGKIEERDRRCAVSDSGKFPGTEGQVKNMKGSVCIQCDG